MAYDVALVMVYFVLSHKQSIFELFETLTRLYDVTLL